MRIMNAIIEFFKDLLKKQYNIRRQHITSEELQPAICNAFRCVKEDVYLGDLRFYAIDFETFKRWSNEVVKTIRREFGNWTDSVFDCEDFAKAFKVEMTKKFLKAYPEKQAGILCGEIWSWYNTGDKRYKAAHAVNWFYDSEKGQLMLIEPQTGEIFDLPDKWHPYFVTA